MLSEAKRNIFLVIFLILLLNSISIFSIIRQIEQIEQIGRSQQIQQARRSKQLKQTRQISRGKSIKKAKQARQISRTKQAKKDADEAISFLPISSKHGLDMPKYGFVDLFYAKLEKDSNWEEDILPSLRLYYGIGKKLFLIYTLPFGFIQSFIKLPILTYPGIVSSHKGILNSYLTLSYPVYSKIKDKNSFIATILFGIELPTLLMKSDIRLANGPALIFDPLRPPLFPALGIVLRGLASYLSSDWYSYALIGGIKKIRYKNNKQGDYFSFGFGLGPIIKKSSTDRLILMADFNFFKIKRSEINNVINPFTGREAFFGGLSMSYSYKQMFVQAGLQLPILENLDLPDYQYIATKFYFTCSLSIIF